MEDMKPRPLTKVQYELEIITSDGEVTKEFSTSYDSEFYNEDKESTDQIFITMRMADLREDLGEDALLIGFSVERKAQIIN